MKKTTIYLFFIFSFLFSVDYETEIQPIWNANCGGCHTSNSQGGLNLLTYENLMSSGTVVAGSALQSSLYDRITRPNSAAGDMPPGNSSLSQAEIDLVAQWINEGALSEESSDISGCMDSNAITCNDDVDPLYFPECDTCSDDDPCDNYYNPEATIDNGLCMYDIHPEYDEFIIDGSQGNGSLYLDWSAFVPPVEVDQYVLMRCADIDGDTDGDGEFEYEMCVLIIAPMPLYTDTQFTDDFADAEEYGLDDIAGIKYTLSIGYPNNNYWGSAFGNYYYEPEENEMLLGDLNFDGIVNVIDVVSLVNGILGAGFTNEQFPVADINSDGIVNVIDIVSLVNSILG
tara:strand:- start:311 stop:1339 length:1029 start_codon:yes stop_codon:yes gene_type:complete